MVLQQQCNAAVWGSTDRGRTVVISPSWTKKKFKAKPDADGKWQTLFTEQPSKYTAEEKRAYLDTMTGVCVGSDEGQNTLDDENK